MGKKLSLYQQWEQKGKKNRMNRDFESLVDDLKTLKAAEEKANSIIEKAKEEANRIKSEAEAKASNVISEQKKRMRKTESELRVTMKKEIDADLDTIDAEYADKRSELRRVSDKRMKDAVSYVLDDILKTEIKCVRA
jgi:vacuolar-type H+-ATPase subunit H